MITTVKPTMISLMKMDWDGARVQAERLPRRLTQGVQVRDDGRLDQVRMERSGNTDCILEAGQSELDDELMWEVTEGNKYG